MQTLTYINYLFGSFLGCTDHHCNIFCVGVSDYIHCKIRTPQINQLSEISSEALIEMDKIDFVIAFD